MAAPVSRTVKTVPINARTGNPAVTAINTAVPGVNQGPPAPYSEERLPQGTGMYFAEPAPLLPSGKLPAGTDPFSFQTLDPPPMAELPPSKPVDAPSWWDPGMGAPPVAAPAAVNPAISAALRPSQTKVWDPLPPEVINLPKRVTNESYRDRSIGGKKFAESIGGGSYGTSGRSSQVMRAARR